MKLLLASTLLGLSSGNSFSPVSTGRRLDDHGCRKDSDCDQDAYDGPKICVLPNKFDTRRRLFGDAVTGRCITKCMSGLDSFLHHNHDAPPSREMCDLLKHEWLPHAHEHCSEEASYAYGKYTELICDYDVYCLPFGDEGGWSPSGEWCSLCADPYLEIESFTNPEGAVETGMRITMACSGCSLEPHTDDNNGFCDSPHCMDVMVPMLEAGGEEVPVPEGMTMYEYLSASCICDWEDPHEYNGVCKNEDCRAIAAMHGGIPIDQAYDIFGCP